MITETNPTKVKQLLQKTETSTVQAQTPEFNRTICEYGHFQELLLPSTQKPKHKLKRTDTTLDYVAAKAATKNKITITYDLTKLPKNPEAKAAHLTQLKALIKILRKTNTKLKTIPQDKNTQALLQTLGASSQQTKILDVPVQKK
jgi:RNase P/RNase MRP subunit p30